MSCLQNWIFSSRSRAAEDALLPDGSLPGRKRESWYMCRKRSQLGASKAAVQNRIKSKTGTEKVPEPGTGADG